MKLLRWTLLLTVWLVSIRCVAYYTPIRNLKSQPVPPNPVTVSGRVTSADPLKVSDGSGEVILSGISAKVGDYLIITGNWNGATLTVSQAIGYLGPARIEAVWVPAGSFLMGASGVGDDALYAQYDEFPQHTVYLSGYWIGKYEVTRGEYHAFIQAGGYQEPAYWSADGWSWKTLTGRTEPNAWQNEQFWGTPPGPFTQTNRHPVTGVSYYEAEAFCAWAGGHLPAEAQWEKAARWTGTTPRIYPWGDTWNPQACNSWDDLLYEGYQTAPVASYSSWLSPFGCHDMAGNVWEWCADWYSSGYYTQSPPGGWIDPQGPATGYSRVLRGGSWSYSNADARCASRHWSIPCPT